jgi:hypothetical protein
MASAPLASDMAPAPLPTAGVVLHKSVYEVRRTLQIIALLLFEPTSG